jgi:hypothetical protein
LPQLLDFIDDWLDTDPAHLDPSLARFVGPPYNIEQLRTDLQRFTFLLGHDDGEQLFEHATDDKCGQIT